MVKEKIKEKELPVIYRNDLKLPSQGDGITRNVVKLGDGWVISFTGVRGSGKSLSMAVIIAKALISGLTVWSNMKVKFKCVDGPNRTRILETTPLNIESLYMLEDEIREGAVAIDELQYLMDSRQSNNTGHRLLNAIVNQIRKRKLDFYYTVKDQGWIDVRLRWETDIEVACRDISKGNPKYPKGHFIRQAIYDKSGTWTGQPWQEWMRYPTNFLTLKKADRYWNIYNTEDIINYLDAMRGVRVDMEKMYISDKQQNDYNIPEIVNVTHEYLQQNGAVPASMLWQIANVPGSNGHLKAEILDLLRDELGLQQVMIKGRKHYKLAGVG